MPYSGNLMYTQAPDARKLPAPDPAHGTDVGDPYAQREQVPAGSAPDMDGTDFPQVVMSNPGVWLATPTGSHNSPALLTSYPDYSSWQADLSTAHDGQRDRGWLGSISNYYPAPLQDSQTAYQFDYVQGPGSTEVNPIVLQRGRNSNSANNPPVEGYDVGGFRHGFWRWASTWRDRQMNQQRRYDMQPLWDRALTVQENSPAPDNAPYWHPFADSLARGITRTTQTPAMAQDPVDMATADLASQPTYDMGASSVIGEGSW